MSVDAVVDPAPAAAVETPPAPADAPIVETTPKVAADRDDAGRFRNPVQPRIDELTKKARENEREAAYWRQRAEAAEKKPPAPAPEKPTPDKFDDYGAYVEALTEFKADEKINKALEARDKASTEKQQTETQKSTWQTRKAEAAKSIPDLDAVLSASEVPLSEYVQKELLDSEFGPQIAYHLDKHPELADKLNGMTDRQVTKEIGRLEATIGTEAPKPTEEGETPADAPAEPVTPAAPAAKVTKAPPPVKPVGQGRSTAVDLAKASMDDYVAQRIAQGASWARR